jgi:aspartate racemase
MTEKTAGVIGGMGPDATVDFMAKVIAATPASKDQDHVHLLVDQNPKVPDRQAAQAGIGENPSQAMAAMAKGLEQAGADFLVMPCNMAHVFAQPVRDAVSLPLVSIIDVSVDACRQHKKIGLLTTRGCLAAGIYQEALSAAGLTAVLQDDAEVAELMRLIMAIKAGDRSEPIVRGMQSLAAGLVNDGAQAIVAACTEIPLVLMPGMLDVPLVSSTDVLAETTVAIATGAHPLPSLLD